VQPEELALSPAQVHSGGSHAGEWFEALFREHYPRVVGMLGRLTGDRGQAEEIAADAFSKLSRRSTLLASRGDVTAWVYRVATNAGLDALRAHRGAAEGSRPPVPSGCEPAMKFPRWKYCYVRSGARACAPFCRV
jgi:DNA-directed RNA polymerase specialized sigma24 family protein